MRGHGIISKGLLLLETSTIFAVFFGEHEGQDQGRLLLAVMRP
jgi:hypothetical protein